MPKFSFNLKWEADKPSQIHCPHCGSPQTVTPTTDDLRNGFIWYCSKCGSRFTHGDPKPVEPKPVQPTIEPTPTPEKDLGLGYPQTRRLFERKKASEWLSLMVGDVLDSQRISTIATKLKAHYRSRFGRNPTKVDNYNSYSGIELNACIERMNVIDKQLVTELNDCYLQKIRREADIGCIIFGNKGIAREVVKIVDNSLVLDFDGVLKRVDRSSVMSIIQTDLAKSF